MRFGTLDFVPALARPDLLAVPTAEALAGSDTAGTTGAVGVLAAEIDPSLADTAAFCEHYKISMTDGANCAVVQARRGDRIWYAACLVRGSDRADVNGVVRRHLDARKLSFASMDDAIALTGMEYGGITPIGLPGQWPILIDESVVTREQLIIGSGIRRSKLLVSGAFLASLPNAEVLKLAQNA